MRAASSRHSPAHRRESAAKPPLGDAPGCAGWHHSCGQGIRWRQTGRHGDGTFVAVCRLRASRRPGGSATTARPEPGQMTDHGAAAQGGRPAGRDELPRRGVRQRGCDAEDGRPRGGRRPRSWNRPRGGPGRLEDGLALGRSTGDRMSICVALFSLAQLAFVGGDYDMASSRFAEGIAPSREVKDRGNVAHILEALGMVAGARGDDLRAARLLGASEALISTIGLRGHPYYRPDRALYERIEAGARTTAGEAAFEAAKEEGRAMSPERAIEYALGTEEPAAHPPGGATTAASSPLSERETEVLRLAADGLTDAQAARKLYVSPRTVGRHLHSAYRKLGVGSRAAATREAIERGLI